ncbi:hypothetical protein V6N13_063897 [Hibiscus sabdariffa]
MLVVQVDGGVPPSEAVSSAHMDSTRVIDARCTSFEPAVAPVLEEPPCLSPSLLSQDNEVSVDGSNDSTEHV